MKERCPICFSNMSKDKIILSCNHSYHNSCMQRLKNFACPICRKQPSFIDNIKHIDSILDLTNKTIFRIILFLPILFLFFDLTSFLLSF